MLTLDNLCDHLEIIVQWISPQRTQRSQSFSLISFLNDFGEGNGGNGAVLFYRTPKWEISCSKAERDDECPVLSVGLLHHRLPVVRKGKENRWKQVV